MYDSSIYTSLIPASHDHKNVHDLNNHNNMYNAATVGEDAYHNEKIMEDPEDQNKGEFTKIIKKTSQTTRYSLKENEKVIIYPEDLDNDFPKVLIQEKGITQVLPYSHEPLVEIKEEEATYKGILKETLEISIPTALSYMCVFIQQTINIAFVSRTIDDVMRKNEAVDAIGISNLYINVTLNSISAGLISAFNVLGGSAISQGKPYLLGLYFHRGILIAFTFATCVICIHFFSIEKGLMVFGAENESLVMGRNYALIAMFFVYFESLYQISYRYLNIAKKGYIVTMVLLATTALHPFWCYIFIVLMELEVVGAAICLVLSQGITGISLLLYIIIQKPIPDTVFCLNVDSFISWGNYLAIALPSCLLMIFEWWVMEAQQLAVIYSGRADWKVQLTTQVIASNVIMIMMSPGYSIYTSMSILAARYIAADETKKLKMAFIVNILYISCVVAAFTILIMGFKDYYFVLFTTDKAVVENGSFIAIYLCLTFIFADIKKVYDGILVGMRKQLFSTVLAFVAYYGVCAGLSIYLNFVLKWGDESVWISEAVAFLFVCIASSIYLLGVDLQQVVIISKQKLLEDLIAVEKINDDDDKATTYYSHSKKKDSDARSFMFSQSDQASNLSFDKIDRMYSKIEATLPILYENEEIEYELMEEQRRRRKNRDSTARDTTYNETMISTNTENVRDSHNINNISAMSDKENKEN